MCIRDSHQATSKPPPNHQNVFAKLFSNHLQTTRLHAQNCFQVTSKQTTRFCSHNCSQTTSKPAEFIRKAILKQSANHQILFAKLLSLKRSLCWALGAQGCPVLSGSYLQMVFRSEKVKSAPKCGGNFPSGGSRVQMVFRSEKVKSAPK